MTNTGVLSKLFKCLSFWCIQTDENLLRHCHFCVHMADNISYWLHPSSNITQLYKQKIAFSVNALL